MKMVGLVGLLVTVAVLGLLVWMAYGKKDGAAGSAPDTSATLGAPPPTDVARNAPAAKEYTQRQVCLADCASEQHTCKALASDPSEQDKCEETKKACEARCP